MQKKKKNKERNKFKFHVFFRLTVSKENKKHKKRDICKAVGWFKIEEDPADKRKGIVLPLFCLSFCWLVLFSLLFSFFFCLAFLQVC